MNAVELQQAALRELQLAETTGGRKAEQHIARAQVYALLAVAAVGWNK